MSIILNAHIMYNFNLKTYRPGNIQAPHYVFILSKGNHAGRPLKLRCANCMILETNSAEAKEFYYWLVYGLFQAQCFSPRLVGSVIPFIRIHDAECIIREGQKQALINRPRYFKAINLLKDFEEKSKILRRHEELLQQVKKAIMYQVLYQ